MRRFFAVLLFSILLAPVFAGDYSEKIRRVALTLDPVPLVTGVAFGGFGLGGGLEYAFMKNFAVKTGFSYTGVDFARIPGFNMDDAGSGKPGPGFPIQGTDTTVSWIKWSLELRWYPGENYVEGFFVNLGYQFHHFTVNSGGFLSFYDTDKEAGPPIMNPLGPPYFAHPPYITMANANTHSIYGGAGYKLVFGQSQSAFALETKLDFTWPISTDMEFDRMSNSTGMLVGWMMGVKLFRLGLVMGVAF